ncbi:hypothetical protein [Micromonospora sp. RHAY321]|nr:hypothetical protein [Micromonospora sp. RHAY321]
MTVHGHPIAVGLCPDPSVDERDATRHQSRPAAAVRELRGRR